MFNKGNGFKRVAILLIVCSFLLSAAAGFTGGVLYSNGNSRSPNVANSADIPVINTGLSDYNSTYSVAGVAKAAADSVVEIVTESVKTGSFMGQYISDGAGSGVILTVDGYIITNNHVIDGASKIKVTLKNGKDYDATLIGTDAKTDLAVIKINEKNLKPATLGNSDSLVVGELAVAIGNPLGQLGGTVTDGIISALDREIEIDGQKMTLLQTNASINPGNSGGGLFNGKAELIGVVNAKSSGNDVEGLGFAIPANTVKVVMKDLINYGYVKGRISTGMTYLDINNAATAWMYRVYYTGVYVYDIDNNSNAAKAGLKDGDLILGVNGKSVSTSSDIEAAIKGKSIGDVVEYTVLRNDQKISFKFALSEYSPK